MCFRGVLVRPRYFPRYMQRDVSDSHIATAARSGRRGLIFSQMYFANVLINSTSIANPLFRSFACAIKSPRITPIKNRLHGFSFLIKNNRCNPWTVVLLPICLFAYLPIFLFKPRVACRGILSYVVASLVARPNCLPVSTVPAPRGLGWAELARVLLRIAQPGCGRR